MADEPSELSRALGAAIDAARRRLGLRQEDMEAKTGIQQTTWSKWMRGRSMGNLDNMDSGLRALGIDPLTLLVPERPADAISREAEDVARMFDAADDATRAVVRSVLEARAAAATPRRHTA